LRVLFLYNEVESLGIQYLSAALRRAGHTTGLVFDPRLFDFFRHEYNSRLLARLCSFEDQVLARVEEFRPDVVAFSMLTANADWCMKYAAEIRRRLPGVVRVAGGYHATASTRAVLDTGTIDWIVRGEAEDSLVELVNSLADGAVDTSIPNLAWLEHPDGTPAAAGTGGGDGGPGELVYRENPLRPYEADLDRFGRPDKELFLQIGTPFTTGHMVEWRRGCPWGCTFCGNNYYRRQYYGDRKDWMYTKDFVRSQSVDRVLEELREIKARHDPRIMRVNDDDICCDEPWLKELSERMTDAERIPFKCFAIPNNINERTIVYLKKIGCAQIQMGVQSLNADIRRLIGRPNSEAQIARAIDLARQHGIGLFVDQIFGLPGETEADCAYMERFYRAHPPDVVSVYWLDIWAGADILQQAVNSGTITQEMADTISSVAESGDISTVRRYHNAFARPYAARLEVRNHFHPRLANFLNDTGLWRIPSGLRWFRAARVWYAFTKAWDLSRWPAPHQGYDMSWARFPRFFLRFMKLRMASAFTRRTLLPLAELPPEGAPYEQRERHARTIRVRGPGGAPGSARTSEELSEATRSAMTEEAPAPRGGR
jgi:radical SAM superfamily enzyme YgiQ (UPF0313 family)